MAIAAFTADAQQRYLSGAWAAMASGDTGAPQQIDPSALVTVSTISGTFSAQTLTWEGSIEEGTPTAWFPIPDIKGVLMTQTAAGILGTGQPVRWIRPNMGGAGATAIVTRVTAVRAG